MRKKVKIPMLDELFKISETVKNNLNGLEPENIFVNILVDKTVINKINEEFYYRNNPNAENDSFQNADEVEVIVNGIKFRYMTNL